MLTVILFQNMEDSFIKRYQFVFLNFQMNKQIEICEWKKGMNADDIIEELNFLTGELCEWKLFIVNGEMSERVMDGELTDDKELTGVIKLLTGKGNGSETQVKGFLPTAVWYIGCCGKHIISQKQPLEFQITDEKREFGTSFRMFWFAIDDETEMAQKYDWFRFNCALMILAINQIPSAMLTYGNLYHLDIILDRELFARYVMRLESRLEQIKSQQEAAREALYREMEERSDYPEGEPKKSELGKHRTMLNEGTNWEELKESDMISEESLEGVLMRNRGRIIRRMYFPKGVLRGEAARIQQSVDLATGVKSLLNESGKDMLERKVYSVLEEMIQQEPEQNDLDVFVRKLRKCEEDIRTETARKQWGPYKYISYIFLIIIEYLMIAPFLWNICLQKKFFSGNSYDNLAIPLSLVAVIILTVLCLLAIRLYLWILFVDANKKYLTLLDKSLVVPQSNKIKYFESRLDLIASYQYCQKVKKEEKDFASYLEKKSKNLSYHEMVWEKGTFACREMIQLLGMEERNNKPEKENFKIDFDEEPKETEYYWVPCRENGNAAEINHSGHMVKSFFDFITGLTLTRTLVEDRDS